MKMEKRALAAIILSIVVLLAFRYFEERRLAQLGRSKQPPNKSKVEAIPPAPPAPPAPAPVPRELEVKSTSVPGDTKSSPRRIVVEDGLYRAVIDSRGGVLASWQLKQFTSAKREVFEMIASNHNPGASSFPFTLILEDETLSNLAATEHYEVELPEGANDVLTPPANVILRLRRGDLSIEKRFEFHRDNYVIGFSADVAKRGEPVPSQMLLAQDLGPESEHLQNPSLTLVAVSNRAGKVHRDGPPSDEAVHRFDGDVRWVGLDMHYFAAIDIPARPMGFFEIRKIPVKTTGLDGKEMSRDLLRLTLPLEGSGDHRVYLGPKEDQSLNRVQGVDLSAVIDFGMFSFLVRPLLFSLKFIETYVHNFGMSIVLLTLLLTLLLFPLRLKQMLSMKKMQVIQPKVKAIQEKYKRFKKTDPRRAEMNQEVMALYKEHNVNPLGGCLPLIVQMPLLFAFYQLLAASIELRGAPFVAWIDDLSVKDPYYVLPIVMGLTMLISQKMTPMSPSMDPTQAKMLLIMPVIFTVMFLNVSSGLNLYFLCSNVFQIGFQKIAERWIGDGGTPAKAGA